MVETCEEQSTGKVWYGTNSISGICYGGQCWEGSPCQLLNRWSGYVVERRGSSERLWAKILENWYEGIPCKVRLLVAILSAATKTEIKLLQSFKRRIIRRILYKLHYQ